MTIINRFMNYLLMLLFATTLISCGVESTDLPPERPKGNINGFAIDSAISGGTVSVYSFTNGTRGERLGGGVTNGAGAFSVEIQAESQLVMVEVTGGSYVEEASGVEVRIADGQNLRSLVYYESGQIASTNVTPLTHMATALAEYKISNGIGVIQAANEAFDVIDTFFKVNSRGTTSVNIAADNPVDTLNEEARYGFYMAGISHWTAWASRKSGLAPHTNYTSIALAKVLYNDIRYDGLMNGVGSNGANNEEFKTFASVPLNADEYRLMFTVHAIAVGMSQNNKTQINVADTDIRSQLEEIANTKGGQSPLLPQDADVVNIGNLPMKVTVASSEYSGIYGQQYSFNIQVESLIGANTILVYLDQDPDVVPSDQLLAVDNISSVEAPVAQFDIDPELSNGPHMVYVVASDIFGGSAATNFEVTFDTDAPSISFDQSPYLTDSADASITGTFTDNLAGVQNIVVGGVEAVLDYNAADDTKTGTWTANLQGLARGGTQLTVTVNDFAGNTTFLENSVTVYFDDQAPVIDTSAGHSTALFSEAGDPLPLADENPIAIYIETNHIQGYSGEKTTTALNTAGIPYFRFTVSDLRADSGIYTDTGALAANVSIKYAKTDSNMDIVFPELDNVAKYPDCDAEAHTCKYFVPLIHDFLPPDWDQATPTIQHVIKVHVTDGAGNEATKQFSFYVDFVVPPIPVCTNPSCQSNELQVADRDDVLNPQNFMDRTTVWQDVPIETTEYVFTNPSDKSVYMSISESNGTAHQVEQVFEQERRIHKVTQSTKLFWEVGAMDFLSDIDCPTPVWQDVTTVWNWDGIQWIQKDLSVEEPTPSDVVVDLTTDSEVPPPPEVTEYPDFDDKYRTERTFLIRNNTWLTDYDYLLYDPTLVFDSRAGYVANWSYTPPGNQTVINCPGPYKHFNLRKEFSYKTYTDPTDIIEEVAQRVNSVLPTNELKVEVDGNVTDPVNGNWYLIPVNANVKIKKVVSTTDATPPMLFEEADFENNIAPYEAPFPRRDKAINWTIDRNLNITLIHNTGDINLADMPERNISVDPGVKEYPFIRP